MTGRVTAVAAEKGTPPSALDKETKRCISEVVIEVAAYKWMESFNLLVEANTHRPQMKNSDCG